MATPKTYLIHQLLMKSMTQKEIMKKLWPRFPSFTGLSELLTELQTANMIEVTLTEDEVKYRMTPEAEAEFKRLMNQK